MKVSSVFAFMFLCCAELWGQSDPAPSSRAEQIENQESAKAQTLTPDLPTIFEQRFKRSEKTARRILQGTPVRLQIGGLSGPSGFAVGPSVNWQNSGDTVRANAWAVGSIRHFYSVGTGLELPRL